MSHNFTSLVGIDCFISFFGGKTKEEYSIPLKRGRKKRFSISSLDIFICGNHRWYLHVFTLKGRGFNNGIKTSHDFTKNRQWDLTEWTWTSR